MKYKEGYQEGYSKVDEFRKLLASNDPEYIEGFLEGLSDALDEIPSLYPVN